MVPEIANDQNIEGRISELLDKFKTKILIFEELCEVELRKDGSEEDIKKFREWYSLKSGQLLKFQKGFQKVLEDHRLANIGGSASEVGSRVSSKSDTSSVVSARIKLAKRKANILTEKKFFDESIKLEQQQASLRRALKELDLKNKKKNVYRWKRH